MDFKKKDHKKFANTTKPKRPISGPHEVEDEGKAAFNWFPGHMMKALREIKSRVGMVDLVVEVRDARLPLVSGSAVLREAIGGKCHLIVLNKANLADPIYNQYWSQYFDDHHENYIFVNCLDRSSVKQVVSKAKGIIEQKRKQTAGDTLSDKSNYKFMVVGLPNTGKSTFINALANRNATKVANKPGQTQNQIWVKVDEQIDLLDTPGVMPTKIEKEDHRTWLSIINAIPDHIVGEEVGACYLVNFMLKHKVSAFQERYKLPSWEGLDLVTSLDHIAKVRGCLQKGGPDYDRVYKLILADFREGLIGQVTLQQR